MLECWERVNPVSTTLGPIKNASEGVYSLYLPTKKLHEYRIPLIGGHNVVQILDWYIQRWDVISASAAGLIGDTSEGV